MMAWLAAAAVLAIAALFVLSRWMRMRGGTKEMPPAFTLDELRKMRTDGLISNQEYEAMRALVTSPMTRLASTKPGEKIGSRPSAPDP